MYFVAEAALAGANSEVTPRHPVITIYTCSSMTLRTQRAGRRSSRRYPVKKMERTGARKITVPCRPRLMASFSFLTAERIC